MTSMMMGRVYPREGAPKPWWIFGTTTRDFCFEFKSARLTMITHTICAFTSTGRNRRKGSGVLPSGRAHVGVQGRVLDVIRGKSYEECLIMLEFMPYRSCEPILSALFSAASNAKNNLGMNKAKLYVSECYADGGATMKRFTPRAQGRPFSIRKRTCSIVLKMKERED